MQIKHNSDIITFDQALALLPDEFKLLDESLDINLLIEDSKLKILQDGMSPFFIDINSKWDYHKTFFFKHSIYQDPLAKALGVKKGKPKPSVIDTTAGALNYSSLITSYGCNVHGFERNPIVSALILNALKFVNQDFLGKFVFTHGEYQNDLNPDVIYYDPMYSEKNSKAAPKKEMQIFRTILSPDLDSLETAKKFNDLSNRLVIKRPIKSAPLLESPSHSVKAKSTRYDVYL